MKPISPEYRQFVLEHAPQFARAVEREKKGGKVATVSLYAFQDNPFLLYAALWYAYSEGVTICVAPEHTPMS